MKFCMTLFAVALMGFVTSSAMAGSITYVDADPNTNTTLSDGTAMVDGTHYSSTSTANDDLWNLRAFANDGTIISAQDSGSGGGESTLNLKTTISGLTPGASYNISAYFWGSQGGQGWRGRASLTDPGSSDPNVASVLPGWNTKHFGSSGFSPLTHLSGNWDVDNPGPVTTADGSGFENGGYFTNSPFVEDGTARFMAEAPLGIAVANLSGEIEVFIGHGIINNTTSNRTWYDGVGYSLIPEPTTMLLGMLGMLGCMVARRER